RIALESAQIGTWIWHADQDGIIAWDAQAAMTVGIAPDAVHDLSVWEALADAQDRNLVRTALERAKDPAGDGKLVVEARFRRPADRAERWLSLYGRVEFDNGVAARICGAVRDVTEKHSFAAESGRAEARLAAIVSIAADAIISLDSEQRISLFNDGAERMFG